MNQTKIFEAIPFLQPKLPAHDMNVRFLTAAQEALENEDVLGRLAEIILESRAMEHDAPVTNFLRVNSLWYNQMVPRLWSDTRACVLREGESTFDFHLSNILNKVRTSERQRHANYMRKARLFACHFLDGAAEAYEKVLTELDFPNLRLVELYITDSQQTFPLAPFPEVSTVVVRALQTYGHFCIDVHMVGAIQNLFPSATKIVPHKRSLISPSSIMLLNEIAMKNRNHHLEHDEEAGHHEVSSPSPVLAPRPGAGAQVPHGALEDDDNHDFHELSLEIQSRMSIP